MQYHNKESNTKQCYAIRWSNAMQCNQEQYDTMQYNEIPLNTQFRLFETSTGPKRVNFGKLGLFFTVFSS